MLPDKLSKAGYLPIPLSVSSMRQAIKPGLIPQALWLTSQRAFWSSESIIIRSYPSYRGKVILTLVTTFLSLWFLVTFRIQLLKEMIDDYTKLLLTGPETGDYDQTIIRKVVGCNETLYAELSEDVRQTITAYENYKPK